MKKIFTLSAAIVLFSICAAAQTFEGKIVYQNKFRSKIPNVTDEMLSAMMGNKQEFFVKGGDYKSVTNGQMVQWQMYLNKDNKLYTKTAMGPVIYWNDANENADEIIKTELNKGVLEVAGYKCDELVLTTKSGVQKFYFNENVAIVNPEFFKNHKFGNWYEVMSRTRSLPLKMSIQSSQFSLENIAQDIIPEKLDPELFKLPEGAALEKNPYVN